MSTIFYKKDKITSDSDNNPIIGKQLYKATFINNNLRVYSVDDSDDEGVIFLIQNRSPFHIDSEVGAPDENGITQREIKEYNRPWANDSEAFAFVRN